MPLNQQNPYYHQVALLVAILPVVEEGDCFALKGGTAINLFFQDMPRLSVDIDLTYLLIEDRKTSLVAISCALSRIAERVVYSGLVTNNKVIARVGFCLVLRACLSERI